MLCTRRPGRHRRVCGSVDPEELQRSLTLPNVEVESWRLDLQSSAIANWLPPPPIICMYVPMYAAIDGLVDKLDRQILKHKEKIQKRARGNGAKVVMAEMPE